MKCLSEENLWPVIAIFPRTTNLITAVSILITFFFLTRVAGSVTATLNCNTLFLPFPIKQRLPAPKIFLHCRLSQIGFG